MMNKLPKDNVLKAETWGPKYCCWPLPGSYRFGNHWVFFDKYNGAALQSVANSDTIMAVIDNLREPIKLMSDTKASAMKYLQNLSKLTEAYSKK